MTLNYLVHFYIGGKRSLLTSMLYIRKTESKIRNSEGEEEMKTVEGNKGKREEDSTCLVLAFNSEIYGSRLTAVHLLSFSTTFIFKLFSLFQCFRLKSICNFHPCAYYMIHLFQLLSFHFIALLIFDEKVIMKLYAP